MAHGDYERLTPQAIDQVWLRLRTGQAAKPIPSWDPVLAVPGMCQLGEDRQATPSSPRPS